MPPTDESPTLPPPTGAPPPPTLAQKFTRIITEASDKIVAEVRAEVEVPAAKAVDELLGHIYETTQRFYVAARASLFARWTELVHVQEATLKAAAAPPPEPDQSPPADEPVT